MTNKFWWINLRDSDQTGEFEWQTSKKKFDEVDSIAFIDKPISSKKLDRFANLIIVCTMPNELAFCYVCLQQKRFEIAVLFTNEHNFCFVKKLFVIEAKKTLCQKLDRFCNKTQCLPTEKRSCLLL